MPEPVKPLARHLEILDELYLEPPTLITSQESEAYEYTTRVHDYRFSRQAVLALRLPHSDHPVTQTKVELSQDQSWTETIGAHPRDPSSRQGDYSDDALTSTRRLLDLEFGAACARSFEELVAEAIDVAQQSAPNSPLALALRAALADPKALALEPEQREALSRLAEQGEANREAFRRACLEAAAQRLGVSAKERS